MRYYALVLGSLCAQGLLAGVAWAQAAPETPPAAATNAAAAEAPALLDREAVSAIRRSWAELNTADFLRSVEETAPKSDPAGLKNLEYGKKVEAARRLSDTDVATQADLRQLHTLLSWGSARLSPDELAAVREKLATRQDPVSTSLSAEDLFQKCQVNKLVQSDVSSRTLITEWINSNSLSSASVDHLEWMCTSLSRSGAAGNRRMWASWTGTVKPPRNGQYTFSPSLIEMQIKSRDAVILSRMKITIDGQLVLDTDTGADKSAPVTLSAEQPSEIKVEYVHKHGGRGARTLQFVHPAVAMLYWQGEGLPKQLVPASALSPPQGTEGATSGLLGEYGYTLADEAEPIISQRVDPQIDFVWIRGYTFGQVPSDQLASRDKVVAELVARYSSQEYLTKLAESKRFTDVVGGLNDWKVVAELMNSAQRQQMLQGLAGNDAILQKMRRGTMLHTFIIFRPGAEKDSIDFIGKWMQAGPQSYSGFSQDFTDVHALVLELGAEHIAFEYPEGRQLLEDKYLEFPDGRCCLFAAKTLAYAHAYHQEFDKWLEKLDSRLANESLTGDKRVSWLLARAHAEELKGNRPEPYKALQERPLAGWGWLDEASLMAQTEEMGLNVYQEKIARVASLDQRERTNELLAQAEGKFTSEPSQKRIGKWKQQLEGLAAQFAKEGRAQVKRARKAHLAELERRMAAAGKVKDYTAAARYQTMLETLNPPKPETPPADAAAAPAEATSASGAQ